MTRNAPYTVAVVQAAPVFLDRDATIAKACDLIQEAGRAGARLVLLPEALVPAYPDWVWAIPPGRADLLDDLYATLVANAVTIGDEATERLCAAAREAEAHVAIGMSEVNVEASGSSLYNTLLYIGDDGHILGRHRKLVATGAERTIWAPGNDGELSVYDTELGKIGGLICWENYMPLARQALYDQGVQIWLAPTWDRSDNWLATLRHIAVEGGVFVLGCCSALRSTDIPDSCAWKREFPSGAGEWINIGNSAVVNPRGEIIAGPVQEREEIVYAEIDLSLIYKTKRLFDAAGHYARPDVFDGTRREDTAAVCTAPLSA